MNLRVDEGRVGASRAIIDAYIEISFNLHLSRDDVTERVSHAARRARMYLVTGSTARSRYATKVYIARLIFHARKNTRGKALAAFATLSRRGVSFADFTDMHWQTRIAHSSREASKLELLAFRTFFTAFARSMKFTGR